MGALNSKAMVLAAGLGTRLKPITFNRPKPMVPILDRPVMHHITDLLVKHGFSDAIANLHYYPDTIKDHFGDGSAFGIDLSYSFEDQLLGTAGGVRNVRDFLGEEPFLIISGDALTDIDLGALLDRHRAHGGVATLTVKRVPDTREYGVVVHDADGRISGFQEKPHPDEALSDLGNCGIYVFNPEIFEYFPDEPFADWAQDVFPVLLDYDVPFYVHEIDQYWNDVGSIGELRSGTFDAMTGAVKLDVRAVDGDTPFVGEGSSLAGAELVEGQVWVGKNCQIGSGVKLQGPVVLGDGVVLEDGAAVRDSIVLPAGRVAAGSVLIGAIAGP